MKIGIPVKCQNGHKSTWLIEISGLDAVSMGTFGDPNRCKCPKHEIGQGYFADGKPFVVDQTNASRDVLAERQRQVQGKGFTTVGDDIYWHDELCRAAACYVLASTAPEGLTPAPPPMWPWSELWWKPRSRREDLVRAGALILAEIERIDRQAAKEVES